MPKNSKQSEFARDFSKEVSRTGSVKSLGDAIGLPDDGDWQNITNIIGVYRKESVKKYGFDILIDCIANARKEYHNFGGKYDTLAVQKNLVNKDSGMRYHFEFPESFVKTIELAYPLMFKDRKHYHWFCKKFAGLGITGEF